ncbi:MAG: hypothetical protein KBG15_14230, partial [Kofleriaceae bacterium]|nr:hypothetical protein [Kofleriaceae bacterium]
MPGNPDRGLFLSFAPQLLPASADGPRMRPAYRRRGAYYFITRRCTQRKFLLLSGKLTDALVTYALANAAKRTHMQILG